MGKASKWIKSFLKGKKDKEKYGEKNTTLLISTPPVTPKEKRRWSFRRSSASAPAQKDVLGSRETGATTPPPKQGASEPEDEQKKHVLALAAATAAAADAAVAAAQAAAVVIALTATANGRANSLEEAAAVKIQTVFRGYLARKALNALKGLVKLQALVRGHLVRKQATATLRCMRALVAVQSRARARRLRVAEETTPNYQRQSPHRKSTQDIRPRHTHHDVDRGMEENIKIVEMDLGGSKGSTKSRNSYSNHVQTDQIKHRHSTYSVPHCEFSKQDYLQISPAPSAVTDMSPRACSGYFVDYPFGTAQSSPQCYSAISRPDPSRLPFSYPQSDYAESLSCEYPFCPNYMANTESSRAKARSQSAPKSRPDSFDKQPSRRRPSIEGRNIPRAVRMQRSSSHVGCTAQNYQYPWSIKLDKSAVSLKDSECASTSTMLTNTNYCRSLVDFEVHGK